MLMAKQQKRSKGTLPNQLTSLHFSKLKILAGKEKIMKKSKPITSDPNELIVRLEADLAAAREAVKEQRQKEVAHLKDQIEKIPSLLGTADLPSAMKLIRTVMAGGASYHRLTSETKIAIAHELRERRGTLSDIADKFSVSIPTVLVIKRQIGLVSVRAPAQVAVEV